jgi:hypothetical protein
MYISQLFGNPAATVITHFTEEFLILPTYLNHYHGTFILLFKMPKVSRYQHHTVVKVFPAERTWASVSSLVSLQRSAP